MQRRLRLRRNSDFGRLRQEGQVQKHPTLLLSYAPNHLIHNRYGFITPKRLGKAVKRNRVRRHMREAVRHLHPHLKQGYDMVIIARLPLMGQPFHKIQRIIDELCDRAGLVIKEF
jgi:ribonuclease P protein component